MKNAKSGFMALLAAATVLAGSDLYAGCRKGDCSGPCYEQSIASAILTAPTETISGTVTEIGAPGSGQGVSVDTGTSVLTVYGFGPPRYWESQGIHQPVVGEQVTVEAYNVTFSDGSTKLIASSVTVGDQAIVLRNAETGMPAWRMPCDKGHRKGQIAR